MAAVYVMTYDAVKPMPETRYRLTITGLAGEPVEVKLYDPVLDKAVEVRVVKKEAGARCRSSSRRQTTRGSLGALVRKRFAETPGPIMERLAAGVRVGGAELVSGGTREWSGIQGFDADGGVP